MIWKHRPLKCYNDKPLLALFQTCETKSVCMCEKEIEIERERKREGVRVRPGRLLHSYTSPLTYFTSVKWKSFYLSDLKERIVKEKETVKSRETHMERQNEEERRNKEAVWLTANTPVCFLSHTWLLTHPLARLRPVGRQAGMAAPFKEWRIMNGWTPPRLPTVCELYVSPSLSLFVLKCILDVCMTHSAFYPISPRYHKP